MTLSACVLGKRKSQLNLKLAEAHLGPGPLTNAALKGDAADARTGDEGEAGAENVQCPMSNFQM